MSSSLTSAIGGERAERLRVVDQPVDPAEALDGRRDHRVDLGLRPSRCSATPSVVDAERLELGARRRPSRSGFHSATTTCAPPLPRWTAMPLPTPRPAPVTMITLPATECIAVASPVTSLVHLAPGAHRAVTLPSPP